MITASVIIPTYNEEKIISQCLKALRNQSVEPLEIIIVDGHSTDSTTDIAKEFVDKIIFENKKSIGHARNVGAAHAKGDLLIFIDADTIVEKDYIAKVTTYFENKIDVKAATGYLLPLEYKPKYYWTFRFYSGFVYFLTLFNLALFTGSNVVYEKDFFKKLGGFPEDLALSEDTILAFRASLEGKIGFHSAIAYTSMRRFEKMGFWNLFKFYLINSIRLVRGKPFNYYPPIR